MKKHIYVIVDVEADGQIPGDYSMISLGAVAVDLKEQKLKDEFYIKLKPISEKFSPEALAVSGFSRDETMLFPQAHDQMLKFEYWLNALKDNPEDRLMFASDNNGFDWMYVNWYFHHFLDRNPFGHSSTNIGSLYKGIQKNMFVNFKHLRKTKHTHNALDDAKGNAEAFIEFMKGVKGGS